MEKEMFDVVILGAGPAGTPCAMVLAQMGKKVLLVDAKGKPGGECLFDGCIPSKIIKKTSEYFEMVKNLRSFGVAIQDEPELVWESVVRRKETILEKRSMGAMQNLEKNPNIVFKEGIGRFLDESTLEIKHNSGESETVHFGKAVVATGAHGFIPDFSGDGVADVITNKEFFDQMELPRSMVMIGGGAIGIEMSQMLSRLGVEVTVLEESEKILRMLDDDVSDFLFEKLKGEGMIKFELGAKVLEVNKKEKELEVIFKKNGSNVTVQAEKVFVSAGRRPNVEGLDLEKAGVEYSFRGIGTDGFLQTSNQNIYAMGDVISGPKFAHTASYEADILAKNIVFGNKFKVDFEKNSWVLFSDPNIVSAGLTQKQAEEKGVEIFSGQYDFSIDAKSQIDENAFGFLKFIAEKKTQKIIGVHAITPNAQSISGEAALIVAKKLTLSDLAATIHPHPTLFESFTKLAQSMIFKANQEKRI